MTDSNQTTGHATKRASRLQPAAGTTITRASDEACRQDLVSFNQMCFDILTPNKSLLMNWHIEAIGHHL